MTRTCLSTASPMRFSTDTGTSGASRSAANGMPKSTTATIEQTAAPTRTRCARSASRRARRRAKRNAGSAPARSRRRRSRGAPAAARTRSPAAAARAGRRRGGCGHRARSSTTAPSSTMSRPAADPQRHAALAVGRAVEIDGAGPDGAVSEVMGALYSGFGAWVTTRLLDARFPAWALS